MDNPNPAIARRIATYQSRRLTPDQWLVSAAAVRAVVAASEPSSLRAAEHALTALTWFLTHTQDWDRATEPDWATLLTEESITAVTDDSATGEATSRESFHRVLLALGRAVGTVATRARRTATVDLTRTSPTRSFLRFFVERDDEDTVEVARIVAGYAPRVLSTERWAATAQTVRELVTATTPSTVGQAHGRLSALCSYLADDTTWDQVTAAPTVEAGMRDVLTAEAITDYIRRDPSGRDKGPRELRTRLQLVARAIGTMPPQAPRISEQVQVEPFLATGATKPIPTAVLAAAKQIDNPAWTGDLDDITRAVGKALDAHHPTHNVYPIETLQALATLPIAAVPATGTVMGTPNPSTRSRKSTATPSKKPSRAAQMRAAREAHARAEEIANDDGGTRRLPQPEDVDSEVRQAVEIYMPDNPRREAWLVNRELAMRLVWAYGDLTPNKAKNVASFVAQYIDFHANRGGRDPNEPLILDGLFSTEAIEAALDAAGRVKRGQGTARSVFRRIAANLRPHAAPAKIAHSKPSPPYTPAECQELLHLAWHQPSPVIRRRLGFIVALGLGAGLDAVDFRQLKPTNIEVLDLDGRRVVVVHVPGQRARARTVPVRDHWVPLLMRSMDGHAAAGLGDDDLLVGTTETSLNVTTPTTSRAVAANADATRAVIARLRNTWLVDVMCAPVSLADLLQAAGVRSARTVTGLLEYCPAPDPDTVARVYTNLAAVATRKPGS